MAGWPRSIGDRCALTLPRGAAGSGIGGEHFARPGKFLCSGHEGSVHHGDLQGMDAQLA